MHFDMMYFDTAYYCMAKHAYHGMDNLSGLAAYKDEVDTGYIRMPQIVARALFAYGDFAHKPVANLCRFVFDS